MLWHCQCVLLCCSLGGWLLGASQTGLGRWRVSIQEFVCVIQDRGLPSRLARTKRVVGRRQRPLSGVDKRAHSRYFCIVLAAEMLGGNVMVVVSALLATSTTVSSFVHSQSTTQLSREWSAWRRRSPSGTRRYSETGRRRELKCGLQITVRIRGKKSREEDYTNQVWASCSPDLFLLLHMCCFNYACSPLTRVRNIFNTARLMIDINANRQPPFWALSPSVVFRLIMGHPTARHLDVHYMYYGT